MSYSEYIADGFADDCDNLIHSCRQAETLTFKVFANIWKDMQLSCIFHERSSGAEVAELSEEVIHIAKHYMVADTGNFEESVAGLFLVYSLMNLQPYSNFASLRIVQEDLPALERIELVARRDNRLDILYVLGSVLIKGPVQYHAVFRERGMEYPIRKYLHGHATVGVRPKGVFFRQNQELDIIRELKTLTQQYTKAKQEIPGLKPYDLNYVNKNFADELDTSLRDLINGMISKENSNEGNTDTSCSNNVKNIKDKAMKAQVNPIRHLIGVADKSPEKKKPITSNQRGKKRVRKQSSTSDSSDYTTKLSDSGTGEEFASKDDLDLTSFDQAVTEDTEDTEDTEPKLDLLEVLRGVTDQTYEAEFVDEVELPSTSGLNSKSTSETADTRKRDLKKTIVKSRFKRMGMLPVANFKTK